MIEIRKSKITMPCKKASTRLRGVAPGSIILGSNGRGPFVVAKDRNGSGERMLVDLNTGHITSSTTEDWEVTILDATFTEQD